MTRLFHVSEQPDIRMFEPRASLSDHGGVTGDAVWAIDYDHLPHYLTPRECPRITLRSGPDTTAEDKKKFFKDGHERVIAVEMEWYERLKSAQLYLYEFPHEPFTLVDAIAGYFISPQPVEPKSVKTISNLIERIVEHGYKLRLLPNLWPLREAAIVSTVQYSIIRIRNAKPKP